MNNMNNFDMSKVMSILSNMDKKDLEEGIRKANEILNNKNVNTNNNNSNNSHNMNTRRPNNNRV